MWAGRRLVPGKPFADEAYVAWVRIEAIGSTTAMRGKPVIYASRSSSSIASSPVCVAPSGSTVVTVVTVVTAGAGAFHRQQRATGSAESATIGNCPAACVRIGAILVCMDQRERGVRLRRRRQMQQRRRCDPAARIDEADKRIVGKTTHRFVQPVAIEQTDTRGRIGAAGVPRRNAIPPAMEPRRAA